MDQTHPSTGLGLPHPGAEPVEGTLSDQVPASPPARARGAGESWSPGLGSHPKAERWPASKV